MEAKPPRVPTALSASPFSGRGIPAPLGTVQRHGLPAGPDQGGAAGPWQSPRTSPGGAGGLCSVTTGHCAMPGHPKPMLDLTIPSNCRPHKNNKVMHAHCKNANNTKGESKYYRGGKS